MLTGRRLQISLAFGSVYILWGSTFVAIRYVTQLLHPAFVSGLRYMIAGVLSMAYLLLRRRSVALSGREWGQVTLLGLLMFTINTTLVSYGGRVLSAGLTALFVASIPLFLAALEALLPGGSTMNARGWIGTLTGFAGLALLTSHGMRGQPLTSETTLACLALLLAAFAWAVGSVIARRMPMSASPLLLSSWQMLYLAIFGSIAGYTSYMFLLRHVRLSAAATYAYINPIVAVLLGWLLLHETLHGVEWVGMGIVIVSVAVVIASKSPAAKPISAVSQT
jgi:drug/metabolite transporter (DMT)-like permease